MNAIIFDFEVFKFNTLLGAIVLDFEHKTTELFQSWNLSEIKEFYRTHKDFIWIGHNNDAYDNHILKAILENKNVHRESQSLIGQKFRSKADLEVWSYDLMCCKYYSLKMTELLVGKALHTSEVDFNIQRQLTEDEMLLTEDYNKDDLEQTYSNFSELVDQMTLRISLLKEFDIDKKYLTATEAKLASMALHARQIPGIEYQYVKPTMYSTLQVKNQDVIDFYLSEGFRKNEKLTTTICGVEHNLGSGGIHGALKKIHETDILYLDVSGYYNLVMINYNLLPRTIPEEGRELYKYMYHEQLALKGVNDTKRWVYKTVLLSVFGASMNKYTDFYDPQVGSLITITGQMFAVDLLEKLEGKIKLIQSNTDGIMVKPLPGYTEEQVLDIVKEWCDRTGFVIKPKKIKELYQRDVNNYCYLSDHDSIETKGDAFIGNWTIEQPVASERWSDKEPAIVCRAAVLYLLRHIPVEETVEKYKDNLLFFQYLCKKVSYDYCTFELCNLSTGEVKEDRIPDLNRAFASRDINNVGTVYKHKDKNGKDSKVRMPNFPDNVFIYNGNILEAETIKELQQRIDWQFYIDRAYKRISEFVDIPQIKEITWTRE